MTDSFRGALPARRFAPLLALLLSSMLGAGNALALNEKEFTADCVRSKRRLSASSLLRRLCGHLSAPRQARVPRGTARPVAPRQRCVLSPVHRRPRFVTRPLHGGTCTSYTASSPLSVPVVDCRHDVPLPWLTCVRPTRRQPRRRVCAAAQAQGRWAVRKQQGRARRMPLGVLWQHENRRVSVPAHVSVSTRRAGMKASRASRQPAVLVTTCGGRPCQPFCWHARLGGWSPFCLHSDTTQAYHVTAPCTRARARARCRACMHQRATVGPRGVHLRAACRACTSALPRRWLSTQS